MTRNDFILVAMLMILSLLPLTSSFDSDKKFAVVKINGVIVREFDLAADETFTIETGDGKNIVKINGGAVSVIAADCPDKICVRRGAIKNAGEVIACVLHKVLIEIAGD